MIKVILPYTFAFMFVAVLVWFLLCVKLFNSLKERHPETYKNMGSPSLFKNNTFSNNITFLKFLFKKEWQQLGDESIEKQEILCFHLLLHMALYLLYLSTWCLMLTHHNKSCHCDAKSIASHAFSAHAL